MADDPINQKQFAEDVAAEFGGDTVDNIPGADPNADFKMPSIDEVWKMIEQMDGISDAEKAELKESLYNPKPDAAGGDLMNRLGQSGPVPTKGDYMIFFAMMGLIVLLFGKQL